jgi:hypothetical protein
MLTEGVVASKTSQTSTRNQSQSGSPVGWVSKAQPTISAESPRQHSPIVYSMGARSGVFDAPEIRASPPRGSRTPPQAPRATTPLVSVQQGPMAIGFRRGRNDSPREHPKRCVLTFPLWQRSHNSGVGRFTRSTPRVLSSE